MIELFEWPPTRSMRAKWVLEELELPFSSHLIDMPEGEQKSDEYRKIHPLSAVPTIKTDAYTLFESVAIVLQLIDENPDKNLAPAVGSPERAAYYQWSIFACAEVDPHVMMFFDNTMRPIGQKGPHDPKMAQLGKTEFDLRADILSNHLDNQDFLVEDQFTGADILIGHSCFMATHIGLIDDYPVLQNYYNHLKTRPAFKRAYREFAG